MWRLRTTVRDVPLLLAMLRRREDRRFHWDIGVDPLAQARAALKALYHGRIVSGGSTLTMQVARPLAPYASNVEWVKGGVQPPTCSSAALSAPSMRANSLCSSPCRNGHCPSARPSSRPGESASARARPGRRGRIAQRGRGPSGRFPAPGLLRPAGPRAVSPRSRDWTITGLALLPPWTPRCRRRPNASPRRRRRRSLRALTSPCWCCATKTEASPPPSAFCWRWRVSASRSKGWSHRQWPSATAEPDGWSGALAKGQRCALWFRRRQLGGARHSRGEPRPARAATTGEPAARRLVDRRLLGPPRRLGSKRVRHPRDRRFGRPAGRHVTARRDGASARLASAAARLRPTARSGPVAAGTAVAARFCPGEAHGKRG